MAESNLTCDYIDIIYELDAQPNLRDNEAEFIISLLDNPPVTLSPRQLSWLLDLKRKYLL